MTATMHQPMWIPAGGEELMAILTRPADPRGTVVTLFPPGGYVFSSQRNRFGVRLAERLAGAGYHVVRFDWHGIGDSTGTVDDFAHDRPFTTDAAAVIGRLEAEGLTRHILVGHCFGSRTLLAYAAQVADLRGVALLSPPTRDLARGEGTARKMAYEVSTARYLGMGLRTIRWAALKTPEGRRRYRRLAKHLVSVKLAKLRRDSVVDVQPPWVSRLFLDHLGGVLDCGVPVLMMFGIDDGEKAEFDQARTGTLGELLDRAADRVTVSMHEGRIHGLGSVAVQEGVIAEIERWVGRIGEERT